MRWWTTAENVTRKLTDLLPNPTFWCRVRLHKWSRWETFKFSDPQWYSGLLSTYLYRRETIYSCTCDDCGKVKYRKQKSPTIRVSR